MKLVDAAFITDDEQEIRRILQEHPHKQRRLTLLLNGYRELVRSTLDGEADGRVRIVDIALRF